MSGQPHGGHRVPTGIRWHRRREQLHRRGHCRHLDREGACPELESNRCEANGTGLSYTEFGAGSARGNICAANSLFGISVSVLASPVLEANDLSGNVLGTIVDHRMPDSGALIVPN